MQCKLPSMQEESDVSADYSAATQSLLEFEDTVAVIKQAMFYKKRTKQQQKSTTAQNSFFKMWAPIRPAPKL